MRVMPIQVFSGSKGFTQLKAAIRKNWKHYLREALGLGIFMVSACIFSALLFAAKSPLRDTINNTLLANILMGVAMGLTALFIFYSRWTSPSGSHINPAVTLTFLRLGKMCRYDALFFAIFQLAGGTIAVYLMQCLLGPILTDPPVNSAATIPGKPGVVWAFLTEFMIAFLTMSMVLFSAQHERWKKYTRVFSACLVFLWVIFAGPVSGFGMNPARSFASALPSGTWTAGWIYLLVPFAGMLLAAQFFLLAQRHKRNNHYPQNKNRVSQKRFSEPLEFML